MNMEFKILCIFVISGFSSIQLTAAAVIKSPEKCECNENAVENICLKPECILTASYIMKNMDASVNPCDNFYDFVCGGYAKRKSLQHEDNVYHMQDIQNHILSEMQEILISKDDILNGIDISTAKRMYKSCIEQDGFKKYELERVKKIFKSLGGFPMLEGNSWSEENFNLMDVLRKIRKMGLPIEVLFRLKLENFETGHTNFYSIVVSEPPFAHVSRFGIKEALLKLGRNKGTLNEDIIKDVTDFSDKIYERQNEVAYKEDGNMTKIQLRNSYPNNSETFSLFNFVKLYYPVEEGDYIFQKDLRSDYFDRIVPIINKTPKKVLANFLMSRLLYILILLTSNSGDLRKESCLIMVRDNLRDFEIAYLKTFYGIEEWTIVNEIIEGLRKTWKKSVKKSNWMSKRDKKKVLKKLAHMSAYAGYNERFITNKTNKWDFFQSENLEEKSFLDLAMEYTIWENDKNYESFKKAVDKNNWPMDPTDVNAYYLEDWNEIYIPAAISRGYFFNKNRPRYVNYGALGFVIGHEIGHGFDVIGHLYDRHGKHNSSSPWTEKTEKIYQEKVECVKKQFQNFTVENVKINTTKTIQEDMTDIMGIKEAYLAYRRWEKKNGSELSLPGLNYTNRQLFWISAANAWCSSFSKDETRRWVEFVESHSFYSLRILRPLANVEDFARDFQCPLGSTMNPETKCAFW